MSLYAWVMAWCCLILSRRTCRHSTLLSQVVRRFIPEPMLPSSGSLESLRALAETKLAYATLCFLVEFQEAQCFFIAAISMVSLYADTQPAAFHSAQNLPSLFMDQSFAIVLGSTGALQVTLTQISLYRVGMNSVYCLLISTISLVFAGFAAMSSGSRSSGPTDFEERFQDQNTIEACGGNPSLRTMCERKSGFVHWLSDEYRMFFYLIPIGILWVIKASHYLGCPWFLEHQGARSGSIMHGKKVLSLAARIATRAGKVIILLAELSLPPQICIGVLEIRGIAHGQNASAGSPEDTLWSFGQVTAMLIWLPVIVKYLYILFCKLLTCRRFLQSQTMKEC
jgi:hypothetical protein